MTETDFDKWIKNEIILDKEHKELLINSVNELKANGFYILSNEELFELIWRCAGLRPTRQIKHILKEWKAKRGVK